MKKSVISYHIPMCSSTFANTGKPLALKITIFSLVQNKRVVYFVDDVADQLQMFIDYIFDHINNHTQDFVIEHLTDLNPSNSMPLIEFKINVFGINGLRLVEMLSHLPSFRQVK